MSTRFAFIFNHELTENGLAYLHFNTRIERLLVNQAHVTSVVQQTHQQATEKALLDLVKQQHPKATIYEDAHGYRYVKKS